jgi:hypothetical protein
VSLDHAVDVAMQRLDFGGVDADPGAAVRGRNREHIKDTATAADNGGPSCAAATIVRLRGTCVEQLDAPGDDTRRISSLYRAGICAVDEHQPAGLVPHPDRRRQRFNQ